ncbi:MAG: thioredoxin domain-containing protein [Deltaproteobacteria bacterium]|nr:thioredoxin domain-containing protein [Deltaproteobacteria bacterium]
MSRRNSRSADEKSAHRPLAWLALLLLLVAVAANIYLTYLYVKVASSSAPAEIDSFCKVNAAVDCIAVAASDYASLFGIPIAVYAIEFFSLAALVVALPLLGLASLRNWDSLLFWVLLLGLPVSLTMAWISIVKIKSLCLLCTASYTVNIALLLALWLINRRKMKEFMNEGPRELRKSLRTSGGQLFATLVIGLLLSQFFWLPGCFSAQQRNAAPSVAHNPWQDLPRQGLQVGASSAKILIEEFSDFQCPSCSRMHEVMKQVITKNAGQVRLVHRDYPLDEACNRQITRPFHEYACAAAIYARCASEQGRFWHYSSVLFANQRALHPSFLLRYARQIGLNIDELKVCSEKADVRAAIGVDVEEGIRRNLRGTPTVYLNGKEISDSRMLDPAFWQEKIDQALAAQN